MYKTLTQTFHVNCRSTTCPYFSDEFDNLGERAARGADGKIYFVPADMTYGEWEKKFVRWYFCIQNNEEAEMRTLIKTIDVTDGQMSMTKAGRRVPLAQFSGHVNIFETQSNVSILGQTAKGVKRIYASFIICNDIDYSSDAEIDSASVYEAVATVQGEHERERLLFAGLRFEDSDPVQGSVTFEVMDLELIRKLLMM